MKDPDNYCPYFTLMALELSCGFPLDPATIRAGAAPIINKNILKIKVLTHHLGRRDHFLT